MSVEVVITDGPLLAATSPTLTGDAHGAVGATTVFEGLVRVDEDGKALAALEYTAYEPMAQNQITAICDDLIRAHTLSAMKVEHSRGRVAVGECSFRLTILSPHRKEGLRAADEFIDRLKRDVPIWKTAVWA